MQSSITERRMSRAEKRKASRREEEETRTEDRLVCVVRLQEELKYNLPAHIIPTVTLALAIFLLSSFGKRSAAPLIVVLLHFYRRYRDVAFFN